MVGELIKTERQSHVTQSCIVISYSDSDSSLVHATNAESYTAATSRVLNLDPTTSR